MRFLTATLLAVFIHAPAYAAKTCSQLVAECVAFNKKGGYDTSRCEGYRAPCMATGTREGAQVAREARQRGKLSPRSTAAGRAEGAGAENPKAGGARSGCAGLFWQVEREPRRGHADCRCGVLWFQALGQLVGMHRLHIVAAMRDRHRSRRPGPASPYPHADPRKRR